ncbi:SRPBCC family protein [Hymenobacter psoromatis]|uniref:SRPBCC family protein n=1 Tax=Hymenobacter psoromatis TaxID=1484116 RepID=UPI001CBD7EF0|nr:SRPBCC family protein [Hymenobacter psoromatis]
MQKNPKQLACVSLALGAVAAAVVIAEKTSVYPAAARPNPAAPAQTDQTIRISAPPEKVWQVLSRVNQWAAWQPDISRPHLNGPLQPGTSFDWKTSGLLIHSTLHTVEPNAALGWSGRAFGSFAVHNWTLTAQPDGSTAVRVKESMEGWLVSLLQPVFQKGLDSSIKRWLARLKQQAEQA